MFIIKLSQHVSGIIMPIIRRTIVCTAHMEFCTGSDGCGCVEVGCKPCALWRLLFDFTVHTACIPAPHSHSHHYQCRIQYAAVHTIVLLMMGIMMPETCWDSLIINIRLVASCWSPSLHPKFMMHGHKSLKFIPVLFLHSLVAGLLAISQYSEGPATGHLGTGFSWFPCVYKQMLRWFPGSQVATTCFSCSPPNLNLLVPNFIFCIHVK